MADREQMIKELKRRDMISQLQARDAAQAEGDATVAAEKKYEETKPGVLEAAAYGVAQGGTRNFADDIAGVIGGKAAKAALQDRVKRSKDDQPAAYTTGEIGAKIATSPIAANPLGAAGFAAADTFASQIGDDKSIKDAAKSATIDAATAGTLTKIMPALSSKVSEYGGKGKDWLVGVLDQAANKNAVKALGGTKGQFAKLGDKANDLGNMLLEEKIVTPLASSKTIAERVAQQGEKLAGETAPIYAQSKGSTQPTGQLLDTIEAKIAELADNPANAPIVAKLRGYQEAIKDTGIIGRNPSELKGFRQGVAKTVNFNADAPSQIASKEMYGLLREAEMGQIAKVDPALREANEGLFKKLHLNSLADDMAESGAARSAANNEIGLNTWQAGNIGAELGKSNLTTALAMAGREAVRRYGNQTAAVGLKNAAQRIEGTQFAPMFAKAAERGPQAIIALHQALRSNPEYQALVGE